MTGNRNVTSEIERDEDWLQQAMPAEPRAPLERIKLRVRLEVQEAWLERNAPADPQAGNLAEVKQAVRRKVELHWPTTVRRLLRGWRWARQAAPWAAAAVVVLAVGLTFYGSGRPVGNADDSGPRLEDWVGALAEETTDPGELAAELTSLEFGVASLEGSLAEDPSAAPLETEMDELDEDIDALLFRIG